VLREVEKEAYGLLRLRVAPGVERGGKGGGWGLWGGKGRRLFSAGPAWVRAVVGERGEAGGGEGTQAGGGLDGVEGLMDGVEGLMPSLPPRPMLSMHHM
jgi:hypothetical protein